MIKPALLLLLLCSFTLYAQKKIDIPNDQSIVYDADIFPYADGSFSILRCSLIRGTSKTIHLMCHYDAQGNFLSSNRLVFGNQASPYRLSRDVVFDAKTKKWTLLAYKRNEITVTEWNEKLETVRTTTVPADLKGYYLSANVHLPDGRIIFYFENNSNVKRCEYDPQLKAIKLNDCFSSMTNHEAGVKEVSVGFLGQIAGTEYVMFVEKRVFSKKENTYKISLMSYSDGKEKEESVTTFKAPKNILVKGAMKVRNIDRGPQDNLAAYISLTCGSPDCLKDKRSVSETEYKLFFISKDGEMDINDLRPSADVSWSGNPDFCCYFDKGTCKLIMMGSYSVMTFSYDTDTGEKSDIVYYEGNYFKHDEDMKILFPGKSDHLLEKYLTDRRFKNICYNEDEEGKGYLFMISYLNSRRELQVIMHE